MLRRLYHGDKVFHDALAWVAEGETSFLVSNPNGEDYILEYTSDTTLTSVADLLAESTTGRFDRLFAEIGEINSDSLCYRRYALWRNMRQAEKMTVYVLEREGRIALRKRPKTGLLAGLWEFPNVSGTLDEEAAIAPVTAWGLTAVEWKKKLTAKHIFTHREWHMTGYVLRVADKGPGDFLWADADTLKERSYDRISGGSDHCRSLCAGCRAAGSVSDAVYLPAGQSGA